ncbi:2Fe-2S iron-sulfur cluster binding domain-containing protein [Novosphingobium sp.]|uniref:2Fe-2S iron-sulfur cluster binding domain-containing protein n=1 Tax=Novosphingobium sp. TaxID=1874826 RepID=UPI002732473C|nr:2Fe-2S iron-sulfur cluster binding domain-containing protein [Novosphingobium sp.]MDP3908526.1 2Fe-2S iron-sulfur cluster binding domain-containing protein [Novosphingobium sp.]
MLTPTKTTIAFSDGIEHELTVEPGQSVLDAALAAQAPVLFQCGTGSCGSCLAHLDEGEAEHRAGSSSSLLPSEREQGYRLLCLTEARGACKFSVGYDSAAGAGRPIEGKCFVNAVERIATDVVRLELELAEGCWMDFRPGQFIQVKVPGTDAVRSYSMATTVADLPKIELLIRILPGGVMSDWLVNRAAVDDVVEVSGPYGQFFLKDKVRAPHVMIAGGTGLAPMLAMIDALRVAPGRKPKVLLSFGCQTPDGLFSLEPIELRQHWMPTLDARISVDRGEPADGIRVGNPVAAITAEDGLTTDSVAYLCGPPAMIEAARKHLEHLGLAPENIFAEQFVASN